jgi:glycosyltransferase involved in cell wall biosynthesis
MSTDIARTEGAAGESRPCGPPSRPELTVVMPVYNEEGAIADAVGEWAGTLDALHINYEFLILDDGSRDGTAAILDGLAARQPRLLVRHKPNSGHGPTLVEGYKTARGEWIFQTDSDRELPPTVFPRLWSRREEFDYLQGVRVQRAAPVVRKAITAVALWTVQTLFGRGIRDVNCPYRLMRGDWVRCVTQGIPANTLTPNIVLSARAVKDGLRIHEEPVEHRHRRTGTVSIRRWKLCKFSARAFVQVVRLRFRPGKSDR